MTLFVVRHTAVADAEGLCYGRTEVALAPSFADEAAAVAAALPGRPPPPIHASPALRCRHLAERLGRPVRVDPRLQELNFGAWEGLRWDAVPADELARWSDGFVDTGPPGGESFRALAARATAAAAEIAAAAGPAGAVIVTHTGVIRALLAWHGGRTLAELVAHPVAYGSVHRLEPPFPAPLAAGS